MRDLRVAATTPLRVALMEDDHSQAELVCRWLRLAGHRSRHFDRGEALTRALDQDRFDAWILDWKLDDDSGVYLLKRIRTGGQPSVPVLIASVRDREHDVLTAFRHGADAYMVKPVGERELVARVEALARRGRHRTRQPEALKLGAYHVDIKTRTVLRYGDAVELTAKDFDLAVLFLHNVGRLLSRRDICESVWGADQAVSACNVNTCVSRLRNRLRLTPDNGWRLAAVYGYGYRLQQVEAVHGVHKRA